MVTTSRPQRAGAQSLRGSALRGELGPALPGVDGSQQNFEKRDMSPQNTLGAARLERMKEGRLVEETQALAQPRGGAEFERQRQEDAVWACLSIAVVDVVPQVAVRGVLRRLGLDHVAMARIGLVEQRLERQHLCDVRK